MSDNAENTRAVVYTLLWIFGGLCDLVGIVAGFAHSTAMGLFCLLIPPWGALYGLGEILGWIF